MVNQWLTLLARTKRLFSCCSVFVAQETWLDWNQETTILTFITHSNSTKLHFPFVEITKLHFRMIKLSTRKKKISFSLKRKKCKLFRICSWAHSWASRGLDFTRNDSTSGPFRYRRTRLPVPGTLTLVAAAAGSPSGAAPPFSRRRRLLPAPGATPVLTPDAYAADPAHTFWNIDRFAQEYLHILFYINSEFGDACTGTHMK